MWSNLATLAWLCVYTPKRIFDFLMSLLTFVVCILYAFLVIVYLEIVLREFWYFFLVKSNETTVANILRANMTQSIPMNQSADTIDLN